MDQGVAGGRGVGLDVLEVAQGPRQAADEERQERRACPAVAVVRRLHSERAGDGRRTRAGAVADGLDATWYESATPFGRDDWWRADLGEPVRGRFTVVSGDGSGVRTAKGACVESSVDGRNWTRAGSFSGKNGVCTFVSRREIRYLRVKSTAAKPQTICLRRLKVIRDGK